MIAPEASCTLRCHIKARQFLRWQDVLTSDERIAANIANALKPHALAQLGLHRSIANLFLLCYVWAALVSAFRVLRSLERLRANRASRD
jgi:hypothetical protein